MPDKESKMRSRMAIHGWRVDGQIHRVCDTKVWRLSLPDDAMLGYPCSPTVFVFSCGETAEASELVHNDWRRGICKKCFPDNEVWHWQITTNNPLREPELFSELAQAAEFAENNQGIDCTFYVNSWPLQTTLP